MIHCGKRRCGRFCQECGAPLRNGTRSALLQYLLERTDNCKTRIGMRPAGFKIGHDNGAKPQKFEKINEEREKMFREWHALVLKHVPEDRR